MRVVVYRGAEKGASAVGRLVKEIDGVAVAEKVGRPARVPVGFGEPILHIDWAGEITVASIASGGYVQYLSARCHE